MSPDETENRPQLEAVYQQIHEHIRSKDEVSFKLMSLIPLISGGGISLLAQSGSATWGVKLFVSVFAAVAVFGIFRWELRNIQWCSWLWLRAESMGDSQHPVAPELRFAPRRAVVGKTQAEVIVYLAVIIAWLLLPGMDALARPRETPGIWVGIVTLALGVVLSTWVALSCPTLRSINKPESRTASTEAM